MPKLPYFIFILFPQAGCCSKPTSQSSSRISWLFQVTAGFILLDSVFMLKTVFLFRREFSFDPTTLEPDVCKVDLEVFELMFHQP